MPSAFSILAEAATEVFAVREVMGIAEWADAHRQLVKGDKKGAWRTDDVPYARGIFDAIADPDVQIVTVKKAAQLGGSEIGYCWLCWLIDTEPRDFLLVMPNEDKCRDLKNNRLLPTFEQCEPVKQRMGTKARSMAGPVMRFDRMNVIMRGSFSRADLEGDSFSDCWVDEVDRCEATILNQVDERQKVFSRRKRLATGTPEFEGIGIDADYEKGTKERFYVPCPRCKEFHTREFRHVRWVGGKKADPGHVRHSAWMRCPHCGFKIEAKHNRWQQTRGVWCPSVCRVSKDGKIVGEMPPKSHRTFHLHGLDNALVPNPYGECAATFVRAGCMRTVDFVNLTLGEAWKAKADGLKLATLKDRCKKEEYKRGEIPAGVLALVASADVQTDRMYAQIWGFGEAGQEAWLIDYATLPRDNGADDPLTPLNKWIDGGKWNQSGTPRSVVREFVDSGDDTIVVYKSCKSRGTMKMAGGGSVSRRLPVKGNGMMTAPSRISVLDKNSAGGGEFAGMHLLLVNSTSWSTWMYGRLGTAADGDEQGMEGTDEEGNGQLGIGSRDRGEGTEHKAEHKAQSTQAGAPLPTAPLPTASSGDDEAVGITPDLHLPRDCDDEFLQHLCTEQLETIVVQGMKKRRWKLKNDHDPNHHADAMKYALAGADAVGARKLKAKKTGAGVGAGGVVAKDSAEAGRTQEAKETPVRHERREVVTGHDPLAYTQRR